RGPATIHALINNTKLYIIVDGLAANVAGAPSSLNVSFDVSGNGGRGLTGNQVQFRINEDRTTQALRGTAAAGFVPDSTITGWNGAASMFPGSGIWHAELCIF